MKKILFLVLCSLFIVALPILASPVELEVPDFSNGIYEAFSKNFTNAAMTGRGNTGVSVKDRINVSTYNPAAYKADKGGSPVWHKQNKPIGAGRFGR